MGFTGEGRERPELKREVSPGKGRISTQSEGQVVFLNDAKKKFMKDQTEPIFTAAEQNNTVYTVFVFQSE